MKRGIIYLIVLAILLSAGVSTVSAESGPRLRRYALFIGSNDGGRERVPLLYASSDTEAIADVFFELGGLAPQDTILCIDPTKRKVESEFRRIKEMIQEDRRADQRTEFFLYYSGHSDEQGLLINGDLFSYRKLRNEMKDVNADISVAILDSCASGAFIRVKGGTPVAPFLMDESTSMKGQVYLSSSSEDEASQESDEIGASFFTHSLISALRGAADFSSDGQITIHEAYQYARSETIQRTENTFAGTQHPSWHIELTGTGDLVLTDLRELNAGIVLAPELEGQIFIRDEGTKLIAEVNKAAGIPITLALPEGTYTVTSRTGDGNLESSVTLYRGVVLQVTIGDFRETERVAGRLRGDGIAENDPAELVDPYFEPQLPFMPVQVSFTPGLSFPSGGSDSVVGLSFNVIMGINKEIRGAEFGSILNITERKMYGGQFAGVGNIVGGDVTGYQGSGVFNIAGGRLQGGQSAGVFNISEGDGGWVQAAGVFNINSGYFTGAQLGGVFNINSGFLGVQGAGVFNISDKAFVGAQTAGVFNITPGFSGVQAGGVFNIAGDSSEGAQLAGVLNIAGDFDGAQLSTVNVAGDTQGTQIGVVNAAGDVSGFQLGLVNIAGEMDGLALGLVNISRNGLVSFSFTGDLNGFYNLDFQSGRMLYTRLSAGTKFATIQSDPVFSSSAGLGLHFDLGPAFIEGDASASTTFPVWGDPDSGYLGALPYPEFRLKAGALLFDRFGGYAGVKALLHVEGMEHNRYAHTGLSYSFPVGGRTWTMYHQFIWGVTVKL